MTTDVTSELHQMIENAQAVEETGEIKAGATVHEPKSNDEFDLPLAVGELKSAGYVMLYDIRDGRPFPWNRNMLTAQLQKTDPTTGKRWCTTEDPGYRPQQGGYMCWLHVDHKNAGEIEFLGFRHCTKKGIPNEYEAQRHMEKKHGRLYQAINELEARRREDARDKVSQQLLERAMGVSAPVVTVPATTTATSGDTVTTVTDTVTKPCPDCGEALTSKPKGVRMKLVQHRKRCPGKPA